MSVDRLHGGNGHFGAANRDVLTGLGDDGNGATRGDEIAANLEKVPPVASQFGLQDGPVASAGGHLGQEEHPVKLGRQLELVNPAVLVDDGVLVLGPPKGQEFVVVVHAQLGGIFSQVLDNLRKGRLLCVGVRPLEVGEAVVRLQGRRVLLLVSVVLGGIVLGVAAVVVGWIVHTRVAASGPP